MKSLRPVLLNVTICCGAWGVLFTPPNRNALAGDAVPVKAGSLLVPKEFIVERVASPPLVEHPMMGGFDDRGRLFITENAGVNLPFTELVKDPPSKVLMLEDTNADGVFDKRTVFADKLVFPSGALWHNGALYVASAPGVWRFEDANGDGVAESRKQIVAGFGSTGNGADLHGPFLGPDGWLYFTDGRNGHDVTLGDGTRWTGKAACIYRCRTDGAGLEVVFGGGFDNPVEAAFTPEGELLVNVNILHAQPHRIDAILFGLEGANYPYADVSKELKRTGDLLPSVSDLGWVATSGFIRYRGVAPDDPLAGRRYYSTQFNTHAVKSHTLERDGAGFKISQMDFLNCDNPDFHPTDIIEDGGGSLLVIDTGGWFRIGCPASQVAKPQAKGAIYRVRQKDHAIGDARHMMSAAEGLWDVARRDSPEARQTVRAAISGDGLSVKLAAAHAAGLLADPEAAPALIALLSHQSPALRRAATTSLGRLRAREAVTPLLARSRLANDRFEEHAILYALVCIADREATVAALQNKDPMVRRAALIALDQMKGGALTADLVTPHLASESAPLRLTALALATSHPDWADDVVAHLRGALAKPQLGEQEAEQLRAAVSAFARAPKVQALVAEALTSSTSSVNARRMLLHAIADSGMTPLPDRWIEPIRQSLNGSDDAMAAQAANIVRGLDSDRFDGDLQRLAHDPARPAQLRVTALTALAPRSESQTKDDFRLLLGELAVDRDPLDRLAAAQAIAASPLDDAQLTELAQKLPHAGPLELASLIAPFARSGEANVGHALVAALQKSKALAGVTPAGLEAAIEKYPPEVRAAAAPLLAKINPNTAAQKARLAELEPLLTGGDKSRGQSVFFSKQASCTTCHAVQGNGGQVGPDLSKIGSIRAGRDLLESIVFPSASFARGYEPIIVQTKSKQVHAGILAAETSDALVLRTPAEVRIARAAVESIRPDRVSVMPSGLDAQLTNHDLCDLLAFLQSLK
jgi:putative membrane-bound dehydrogenase-like protein